MLAAAAGCSWVIFGRTPTCFTACVTTEWINIHDCEPLGHNSGVHIALEEAERLGREGEAFARHLSFKHLAKVTSIETAEADELYKHMGKHTDSPELKTLADDLYDHENALRDWMKSELDGNSDGGEKIFAWLERHGVSRKDAVTPRKLREDVGGDKQELVLAFFDTEAAADAAAETLRKWEKASEYMRVDAIGVLVKGDDGKIKEHKLGRPGTHRGQRPSHRVLRLLPVRDLPDGPERAERRQDRGDALALGDDAVLHRGAEGGPGDDRGDDGLGVAGHLHLRQPSFHTSTVRTALMMVTGSLC